MEYFSVVPKEDCPHVGNVPTSHTFSVRAACAECGDANENWVCCVCDTVCCGRHVNRHMLAHYEQTKHAVVLSFSDLSVWCYECDCYIVNHGVLGARLRDAHEQKFGAPPPESSSRRRGSSGSSGKDKGKGKGKAPAEPAPGTSP